jgi:hypothetical protein
MVYQVGIIIETVKQKNMPVLLMAAPILREELIK